MLQKLKNIMPFGGSRQFLPFVVLFKKFKSILERNNKILELMADMGDKLSGEYVFDRQYLVSAVESLCDQVFKLISDLSVLSERKQSELFWAFERIQYQLYEELAGRHQFSGESLVTPLLASAQNSEELAGGKMAVLGEISRRLQLPTLDGFVITTKAFFDFMRYNDLIEAVERGIAGWDGKGAAYLRTLSDTIRERIIKGRLPRTLATQIEAQLAILQQAIGERPLRLAVRSSAWGENGDVSFAGQYLTLLNVSADGVLDAYRQVLASAYSSDAWRYRRERGYREHEIAMAVGCQLMAPDLVCGVVHSCSPIRGGLAILIQSIYGLGVPLVGGEVNGDRFILSRTAPYTLLDQIVAAKPCRLVAAAAGGVEWQTVSSEIGHVAALQPEQCVTLAQIAITLEQYYKRPQEIEWALDRNGRPLILQTRPLRSEADTMLPQLSVEEATRCAEVVFRDCGLVAQRGVAVGKVKVVNSDTDLESFPHGAILVSKFTSPRYAGVMCKTRGIITDVGSPAGHMSTLAREYRVPTLVNTEKATSLLHDGDEITLDATQNVVYRGRICELDQFELTEELVFEESYEYRLLRRLLKQIAPLNLVDPHAREFNPSACRTFHDITRLIHEKAVESLIDLSERYGARNFSAPKRLLADLPLGLVVIDAGGGLNCPADAREVVETQVESLPLKELLVGIHRAQMWGTEPVSVDIGSFMSSFTRTFSSAMASPQKMGRNLVVVFKEYMNLHLRLGYHFIIIDAYVSETINDNYIYFRFLGGATEFLRRSRRVRFIREILVRFDFRVELHGDLVVGRIKKLSPARLNRRLHMLGGLIGYTRQLDARMHDDDQISHHVERFLETIHESIGGQGEL